MRQLQLGLVRVTEAAIVVLAALFTMAVIYAVFSRYVFGLSVTWIEEVVRFGLVWIVFLGISVVMFERGHMAMEAIQIALPPIVQKIIRLIFSLLILGFLAVVLVEGAKLALSAQSQSSPVTGVRYVWPYLSLPVGAALAIIQALFMLADDLRQLALSRSGQA